MPAEVQDDRLARADRALADVVVWRRAVRARPDTIVKSTVSWPVARSATARSAATSSSDRPSNGTATMSANAASAAAPTARSRSSSSSSFTARSSGIAEPIVVNDASGAARCRPSTCEAPPGR